MRRGGSTLLDILSSQQIQIVILLTLGLDIWQIADVLETREEIVCNSLNQILDQADCRSKEGLAVRLLFEFSNNLYDDRLEKEVAELQKAAKRMLGKVASTLSATAGNSELPPARWLM